MYEAIEALNKRVRELEAELTSIKRAGYSDSDCREHCHQLKDARKDAAIEAIKSVQNCYMTIFHILGQQTMRDRIVGILMKQFNITEEDLK